MVAVVHENRGVATTRATEYLSIEAIANGPRANAMREAVER